MLGTIVFSALVGAFAAGSSVYGAVPVNTMPPALAGIPRDGERLTATPGEWAGSPPINYAYRWSRCDQALASCADIVGATVSTYTLTGGDVGARVLVAVTAANADGSATASSTPTDVVAAAAPVNITRPDVSGTARDGELLTTTDGRWTGTQPLTIGYQWRRCDLTGNICDLIDGATAQTYRLTSADVGFTIRARVIGTNVAGSTNRSSLQTVAVAAIPLANTAPPVVSGVARDGERLTATSGHWTGSTPIAHAYQWRRCDQGLTSCVDITGATGTRYTLTGADVGARMRVAVTGKSPGGSMTVSSTATDVVAAVPPANITRPAVSGTARDGEEVTTTDGRWTGTQPISYTYQWRRCDVAGENCLEIDEATAQTYRLASADVGSTIRARVIATNVGGSTNRSSLQTAQVTVIPVANTAPPAVAGIARDGERLTATSGHWTGSTPIAHAYQWRRCDAAAASCTDIAGATGASYTLTGSDVGARVLVTVTAANAGSSATVSSTATEVVALLVVSPTVETVPIPFSGDAADDVAIWVERTTPERSAVIGTNKAGTGGLAVYDLSGAQISFHADGKMNNVDLRDGFLLGGLPVTLVTAGSRSTKGGTLPNGWIGIYRFDPLTRTLVNVAAGAISPGIETYGSCMYRSPVTGKVYYFVNSDTGEVEQWELFDNGLGQVDATRVRSFAVGSITEGCVADDELGHLYIGEERRGIWKYSAEPDGGTERVQVDSTGPGGHLVADVEGLALVYGPGGSGYLLASSQGNDSFVVYRREGRNEFVRTFKVVDENGIDGAEEADGIDATPAALGPSFPQGVFVAHDGSNGGQNQNYKLVPLETILR